MSLFLNICVGILMAVAIIGMPIAIFQICKDLARVSKGMEIANRWFDYMKTIDDETELNRLWNIFYRRAKSGKLRVTQNTIAYNYQYFTGRHDLLKKLNKNRA